MPCQSCFEIETGMVSLYFGSALKIKKISIKKGLFLSSGRILISPQKSNRNSYREFFKIPIRQVIVYKILKNLIYNVNFE